MKVFVDTSAMLAILDADDQNHSTAKKEWKEQMGGEAEFFCSNYILVETFALLQHRFGMSAVLTFNNDILPLLRVFWVDEIVHQAATSAFLAASRRLSLVDCVSFETMRSLGIKTAFSYDKHFSDQGFDCIPKKR